MEEVFSTAKLAPKKRYSAWQDAICDIYLKVDVKTEQPYAYEGFVREDRFGRITITDTFLSPQRISRCNRHVARLDKDCYYVQFIQRGHLNVEQSGTMLVSNAASAALFSATEPYRLVFPTTVRAYYLEVPSEALVERLPSGRIPVVAPISTSAGLGKIAAEFCDTIASSAGQLSETVKARIGEELIDVLALAIECGPRQIPSDNRAVRQARLRSIKSWIEANLSDSTLSLERVARSNRVSLRQLHYLFELCDSTPSDWIWQRRLQRCYESLANDKGRSLTEIAFEHGFSSSSHFSTLFRRSFGVRPSDMRRSGSTQVAVFRSS